MCRLTRGPWRGQEGNEIMRYAVIVWGHVLDTFASMTEANDVARRIAGAMVVGHWL